MIQVTEIDFDFTSDNGWEPSQRNKDELKKRVLSMTFDCDENDLVDTITDATGWLINHIDYVILTECN